MLWMQSLYPNNTAEQWQKLANKTLTVTKGWRSPIAYSLKGEGDFVLIVTPHLRATIFLADKKDNYAAAIFDEGHYLQVGCSR